MQALLVLAALPALYQQAQFEVASIKPSNPNARVQDMRILVPPGRFEAQNATLKDILMAFSGFAGKVQGGPSWADSERYDIVAKAAGEIPAAQINPMVMALLEDRFKTGGA